MTAATATRPTGRALLLVSLALLVLSLPVAGWAAWSARGGGGPESQPAALGAAFRDGSGGCALERAAPLPFGYEPSPAWQAGILRALDEYAASGTTYTNNLADYAADGDYLNWGKTLSYEEGDQFRFDAIGIPMVNVNHDGVYHYQTVTTAQYALMMHGRWRNGMASEGDFLRAADFLLTLGDGDGGFPMQFPYEYYLTGETLKAGWQSGMAYGHVLSVLARAYLATGDERYREAGDAALARMERPASDGGTLYTLAGLDASLGDYIIFEEYPSTPTFYTLNGFMFTMVGLYDWWQIDPGQVSGPSADAHAWFECSMATLTTMLPLFDVGGMSAYDLGHVLRDVEPNTSGFYHAIHIELLHALESVTGDPTLAAFEDRWRGYVD